MRNNNNRTLQEQDGAHIIIVECAFLFTYLINKKYVKMVAIVMESNAL